jgi:hypothetical protein
MEDARSSLAPRQDRQRLAVFGKGVAYALVVAASTGFGAWLQDGSWLQIGWGGWEVVLVAGAFFLLGYLTAARLPSSGGQQRLQ